jgi:Amt family ammonium transporter
MFAGLIASSAPCGYVDQLGAVIIGTIAGLIFSLCTKFVKRFEIDDPLEITQTHLACGIWGVLSVGFLHIETGLLYVGDSY